MRHPTRFALVAVLAATAIVASCSEKPGNPDGGGPDGSTTDATGDVALEDAGADAAVDTGIDAGDADIPDAEAGDADVADAGDAGSTARFVITSCTTQQGTQYRSTWIDSEGNTYAFNGPAGPGAGGTYPSPAPPGWPAPYGKLTPAQLANLVAAAGTLDMSAAGHTTTVGTTYHMVTWTGNLRSAGRLGSSVFVDSLTDGVSYGKETIVLHNDPAAVVVRVGRCFSVVH